MRTIISSSVPAHIAERISDQPDWTPQQERELDLRAEEIVAERLADREWVEPVVGIRTT